MYLSLTALIVAGLALINSLCGFQESNLVISFLGVLVTLLVGWNIIQYIFAKEEVHRISKEESDKAAGEAAERVQTDLKHVMDALSPLINARIDTVIGDSARAIGYYLTSLDNYNHIQDSSLHQEYTSNLLEELLHRVQTWKKEETLYVEKQYIAAAVTLLDTFDNPSSEEIKEALLNADERNPNEKMYITSMRSL